MVEEKKKVKLFLSRIAELSLNSSTTSRVHMLTVCFRQDVETRKKTLILHEAKSFCQTIQNIDDIEAQEAFIATIPEHHTVCSF